MPDRFKRRILDHLSHRAYEPRQAKALAEQLGVDKEDYADFREALEALADEGQVVVGSSQTVALPPIGREVVGRFSLHERGFGFVIPDETNSHGDLFVPAPHTNGALTGDRVRAKVRRERGRPVGRIEEILQRGASHFVGSLQKKGDSWLVFVDGKAMPKPIVVRDPGAKHAHKGTKVVVELTHYPERDALAEGVITEVLGPEGEPNVETVAICRAFGLADEFPEKVLREARALVKEYDDPKTQPRFLEGRTDLRKQFTVTIDPPDAQDYDDAISVSRAGDGGWELGVHIADVAAFVTRGSELDTEARTRGNSAYLPRLVIPMLPEVISNGICSLQPRVPRAAKSVFVTYDKAGKVQRSRFVHSVIESNHRLTYLEAQALIDGDPKEAAKHARADNEYTDELIEALRQMAKLAKAIRKRREKAGMIVLDLPEVELKFDDEGNVVDAHPEDDAFTHQIIEAFMVEANEAVARTFASMDVPLIRRIHPDPPALDLEELRQFTRVAGYNIPANPSRSELQSLIESVRSKPAARAVHLAVLKTLTKAEYSPMLIGHFALASEHYTHFTSPIRRYPDLLVHRALDGLFRFAGTEAKLPKTTSERKKLGRRLRNESKLPDEAALADLGRHCSTTERNAEHAERELRDLLVLQLLEDHVGNEYDGTATGVTGFGVFIQIDKYLVEGLIRTNDLPGAPADRWKLNEHTGSLTAQRSGRSITIGDQFRVRIEKVDTSKREMTLAIVEDGGAGKGKGKGKGKRHFHADRAGGEPRRKNRGKPKHRIKRR